MRDEMNRNPMVATGTPTLVTGALSLDTNQGLQFNGASHFMSAADSTTLSVTSSMSLECFFKCSSLPGSTQTIFGKASSYVLQINSSGKILWRLDNGGSNVTVTSNATISTGTWYHLVGVYNDNYAGAEQFGNTSAGASTINLDDDNGNNKISGKFTLSEAAILDTVYVDLQYYDESAWTVNTMAHVYTDSGSTPDDLVTTSALVTYPPSTPDIIYYVSTAMPYPLEPAVVPAGVYWLGITTDTVGGVPKSVFRTTYTAGTGTRAKRPDSVSSPSDPWGSVTSSGTENLDIYCDYTAIARTGDEGKAILYINGALDNSSAYTSDIGDNANALQQSPASAFFVDEPAIYGRALTPVEIATHYLAK